MPTGPLTDTGRVRVLHVDDEQDFVETVAAFLERENDGLDVTTRTSVTDALEALDDSFDCIVSDYEMPGMDGLEFLEAVRETHPSLPFILFTGRGSEEIAGEALSAGATGYLRKNGGTAQFTVLANDIYEAVSKVRAETNYRELFTATADGILVLDPETGTIVDANPGFCDIVGRSLDSLTGRQFDAVASERRDEETAPGRVDERDDQRFSNAVLCDWLERTLDDGTQTFEWEVVGGDGESLWVELQCNPTRLGGEERVLALVRDISDRKSRKRELKRREKELDEARERYRSLVSNVEDYAVCELDESGHIVRWNETVARVAGYSEDEALGLHFGALYTDEDTAEGLPERLLDEANRTGRAEDQGWRVRSDGSRFWATVVFSALDHGAGDGAYEVLIRDLSEAREREKILARVQDRYQQLVEQNLVGIYVIQNDSFAYANPRLAEIFGYEPEELMDGRSPLDLISEEYHDEVSDRLRRRLDGEVKQMEYQFEGVRADGEHILVEVHGSAIEYDGAPAVMGSLVDVTEREERREELLRYRHIFEAMGDGAYKLDRDGRVTDCNRAAETITGYDRDDLVGEHVSLVLSEADIEQCEQGIQELLTAADERVKRYEVAVRRPDGETVPCELTMTILPLGPHNELRGTVGVLRDLSAVKERERSYEAIFNQTYQFIGLLDPDGTVREVNETALSFGGLDKAEVVGKPMWETTWLGDEGSRAHLRQLIERAADGEFVRSELTVCGPGRSAVTDFSIKPVTNEQGDVVLLIPEARDITDRVSIERELRESRRKFSTLLSNLPGMAYRCANEPAWPMEFVSDGCVGLTGYERHELESHEVNFGTHVTHPDDRDEVWEAVQAALDAGEPFELTYRIVTKDGDVRWVWEQGEGIYDDDDKLVALEGFMSDVTQRRKMEEELRIAERSMRELAAVASRADLDFETKLRRILAIGRDRLGMENGHLTRINRGTDSREVVAVSGDDAAVSEGDVAPLSEAHCGTTMAMDGVYCIPDAGADAETRFRSYVGTRVAVHNRLFGTVCFVDSEPHEPFTDAQQTFVTLVAQWVQFELERDTYERQLMRENERLDDFASVVSHDLRNPLDVISVNLELAREDGTLERLDAIERATVRMRELIEDLLTLTRQGRVVGETAQVDIGEAVRAAWKHVETGSATLTADDDLGTIVADEPRLVQVFENLFRNAIEHADSDVTVAVGALPSGFFVEDDGPGIPAAERGRVFDHGYTTTGTGTGFGLSIVHGICAAHQWDVRATEGDAGGTRIEVTFPPTATLTEADDYPLETSR